MMRSIVILHRYTGVLVGLVMVAWCLSGFVMMYQSFPELTQKERLAGLEPLGLTACCRLDAIDLADDAEISDARMEMLAGRPVLRLSAGDGPPVAYDIATGVARSSLSGPEILAVAQAYGAGAGIRGEPRSLGVIENDQWSIQGARRNQPVHHLTFDDPAGTEIYVSGASGEAFQDTTRRERVLSWLGAVPHWLYPTLLRQNGLLWSQVVIWASTIGTFLTVTGLWVGITHLRKRPSGRWSPFHGLWLWHHMTGLIFGVLTLTWVVSGLLSMNPWGLLEGGDGAPGRAVAGPARWGDVKALLTTAPAAAGGAVQLAVTTLGDESRLLATDARGEARRLGADGQAAPLREAELAAALAAASEPVADLQLIDREDAYYYGHHAAVSLPVYRAILGDPEHTRLYIDPATARILRQVDADGRAYRWLQKGLHDFDFPGLRRRPVWDLIVLPLLAGVTLLCGIGVWLSFSRVGRDLSALRRLGRAPAKAPPSVVQAHKSR